MKMLGRLRFVFRCLSKTHQDAMALENTIITCYGLGIYTGWDFH